MAGAAASAQEFKVGIVNPDCPPPPWKSWEAHVFLWLVVLLGYFQLSYLNFGMQRFSAVKFLPAYNASLITLSTLLGMASLPFALGLAGAQ